MFEASAEGAAAFLAAVREQVATVPARLPREASDGLVEVASALDALEVQLQAARVALVCEVETRGVVAESSTTNASDWLMLHSLHLEPAEAARTAEVARACREARNQVLSAAVCDGSVTVRKAATCLRQLRQVEHRLDPTKREQALASLTQMARSGYDRHVRCVGRRLMALVGADRALEHDEVALRRLSSLRRAPLENGMVRYVMQLDPEAAAVLDATIDPLSAPQPSAEAGPDTRLAEQRRAEALVEVCRRAVSAGGGAPATVKTQVVVTIDVDTLRDGLRGSGTTLTGEPLSPETIRKMACDAGVIPVVLGAEGEVLDVGRQKRLVTPGQLRALWLRDKGCTFPGCGRPAHWTHAHHNRHWADGGATSIDNLALLCARHHTTVHDRGLVAEITATGVTWPT
jgi:hypothetical protein